MRTSREGRQQISETLPSVENGSESKTSQSTRVPCRSPTLISLPYPAILALPDPNSPPGVLQAWVREGQDRDSWEELRQKISDTLPSVETGNDLKPSRSIRAPYRSPTSAYLILPDCTRPYQTQSDPSKLAGILHALGR